MLELSWDEFVAWVEHALPGVFDLIPSDDTPLLRRLVIEEIEKLNSNFYSSLEMIH